MKPHWKIVKLWGRNINLLLLHRTFIIYLLNNYFNAGSPRKNIFFMRSSEACEDKILLLWTRNLLRGNIFLKNVSGFALLVKYLSFEASMLMILIRPRCYVLWFTVGPPATALSIYVDFWNFVLMKSLDAKPYQFM